MPNSITIHLQCIEINAHLLAAVPVERLTDADLEKISTVSVLLQTLVQQHIPALKEPVQSQAEENTNV